MHELRSLQKRSVFVAVISWYHFSKHFCPGAEHSKVKKLVCVREMRMRIFYPELLV